MPILRIRNRAGKVGILRCLFCGRAIEQPRDYQDFCAAPATCRSQWHVRARRALRESGLMGKVLGVLLACCTLCHAAEPALLAIPKPVPQQITYKLSLATLAAGTALDAASSWGHYELNPFLRGGDGRFGARGLAVKGGITVGLVGLQYVMVRKYPRSWRFFSVVNFSMGAAYGGIAARNWGVVARAVGIEAGK